MTFNFGDLVQITKSIYDHELADRVGRYITNDGSDVMSHAVLLDKGIVWVDSVTLVSRATNSTAEELAEEAAECIDACGLTGDELQDYLTGFFNDCGIGVIKATPPTGDWEL